MQPGNQATGEQIADLMRRVLQLGKACSDDKLRL